MGRIGWRHSRTTMIAGTALLFGALLMTAGVAVGNGTDTYTACVTPGGELTSVAIGDSPTKACRGNSVQISWNAEGSSGADGADGADGTDGAEGAEGVEGPAGEKGDKGDPGPASGAASQVVWGADSSALSTAVCPTGTFAMGGGFFMTNDSPPFASFPSTASAGVAPEGSPAPAWSVIKNPSDSVLVTAYAICAP
jgi:hypothetical protein